MKNAQTGWQVRLLIGHCRPMAIEIEVDKLITTSCFKKSLHLLIFAITFVVVHWYIDTWQSCTRKQICNCATTLGNKPYMHCISQHIYRVALKVRWQRCTMHCLSAPQNCPKSCQYYQYQYNYSNVNNPGIANTMPTTTYIRNPKWLTVGHFEQNLPPNLLNYSTNCNP